MLGVSFIGKWRHHYDESTHETQARILATIIPGGAMNRLALTSFANHLLSCRSQSATSTKLIFEHYPLPNLV
jgi:hypothetical protein